MPKRPPSSFTVGTQKYTIDCYAAVAGPPKRPVVVVLHGVDGMVGESDTEVRKFADEIAGDGYLVFIPHYLGAGGSSGAMPPLDVLIQRTAIVNSYRPVVSAAVDYALAQPDADTSRFGLVGLSLGGGLALWYAESAATGKVRALVDFFGYISDAGVYANVGKLPPTLVFHNQPDDFVKIDEHSNKLLAELKNSRVTYDYEIYNEPYEARYHHTFPPGGPADVDSRARTRKWLDKYVKP
jgi:dienelactone hydrolase